MHYIMECPLLTNENGEALMEIHNCFRVGNTRNWGNGLPFKENTSIPTPIEIDFEPFHNYQGKPLEMLDACIPIMSKRLRNSLDDSGINNIDYYPAILRNTETGETYKYFAFKIIGLVAAANLKKSEYTSFDNDAVTDTSFEKLSLEESKYQNFQLFRLAENISALVVNEKVKRIIESDGIDTITFLKPEEFVQI